MEGRKEENDASVSARFYLLNLCRLSLWDNMAIQSLSNQPVWLPSQTSSVKEINPSTVALPPAAAPLLALVLIHPCTQPRRHCDAGTDGLTRGPYNAPLGCDMWAENDTFPYRGRFKGYTSSNAASSIFLHPGFTTHRQNPKWLLIQIMWIFEESHVFIKWKLHNE